TDRLSLRRILDFLVEYRQQLGIFRRLPKSCTLVPLGKFHNATSEVRITNDRRKLNRSLSRSFIPTSPSALPQHSLIPDARRQSRRSLRPPRQPQALRPPNHPRNINSGQRNHRHDERAQSPFHRRIANPILSPPRPVQQLLILIAPPRLRLP